MSFSIDMCAETVRNKTAGWTQFHKVHKCTPHTTGLCLYRGMCQTCWLPQVHVSMDVCVKYAACHMYMSLWRYVSDTLAATCIRLYGGMCQIVWVPQVSVSMEECVSHAGCHIPQVHASIEVCVKHASCHRYLSL